MAAANRIRDASSAGPGRPSENSDRPAADRRHQTQHRDNPARRIADLAEGTEECPGHALRANRNREAAPRRLPHAARHERLTPETAPPPHRPHAHPEGLAHPVQTLRGGAVPQGGQEQDEYPEEHLAPQKPQRSRRHPTPAPFPRAAEAEPHCALRAEPGRTATRLPLVPSAVQHSTTRTPGPPRLRREVLVERQQQIEKSGILKQGLVQVDLSFRFKQRKERAPRGRRQAGPRGFLENAGARLRRG